MTFKQWRRRLIANLLPPIVWALIKITWKTCRIKHIVGEEHLQGCIDRDTPFIPCYWHQQQIFCMQHLLRSAQQDERLKLGYLISPSSDGDVAANMFARQKITIIRGSATRGGAQALREIYLQIRKEKLSPIVTPDGPTGPLYRCKPGVAMLSQLSGAPMLPLAYAASSCWYLTSWDRFMLPKPFSTIVIAIGQPIQVEKADAANNFANSCQNMNVGLNNLFAECQKSVKTSS